jgi:two-component system LytT family sensor kinase
MLNLVYKSPGEVETIILNLSEIYRRILQLPEDGLISIQEEMEFIRQYLEIEKIRLGERLAYTITVDPAVASIQIPPMIIEPIIENAVIHGIGPKPEGGSIRINAQQDAGVVRFIIEDDGAGVATQDINQGFGLYSVQERLRLMYRGKATFVLRALPGGGVKVMVELPHAD